MKKLIQTLAWGAGKTMMEKVLITVFFLGLVCGCTAVQVTRTSGVQWGDDVLKEVMARRDKIILLSSRDVDPQKPALLLLHGATDDPTEMRDIANQWQGEYNVFLYSYDDHQRIQKIGRNLVLEMKALKRRIAPDLSSSVPAQPPLTILTYSYSACVLREAVLLSLRSEPKCFAGASLIQLVPTAGGSSLAGWMMIPVAAWLTGLASPISAVENPRGKIAIQLWDNRGNQDFCKVISPGDTHTILMESDPHSLASFRNAGIHRRYQNGIGTNVVVIPKTAGANHEYFPSQPAVLACLRPLLERTPGKSWPPTARR